MSRNLFPCPATSPVAGADSASLTYNIDVITPMFGGSATARKVDLDHPVRISEIRGCLRFWWRATRGAGYDDAGTLRAREAEIWGSTKIPSATHIELAITSNGQRCPAQGNPACAVYPFKGDNRNSPEDGLRGVGFVLNVHCPARIEKDVVAAVWAWVNFGGIGARTRRGAGALYCAREAPMNRDGVGTWLGAKVEELGLPTDLIHMKAWPLMLAAPGYRPWLSQPCRDGAAAWKQAVDLISDFRQRVGTGRNAGPGPRPRRSRWPEADSLRALTGRAESAHNSSITLLTPALEPGFPRADLGLPLILKFYHDHYGDTPNDCEITPMDPVRHVAAKRMASPVLLRPFKMQDGQFCAMAMRLHAPPPEGIAIKFADPAVGIPPGVVLDRGVLRGARLGGYPISPMGGRSRRGSAVEALMVFARQEGFQEVR
jgi:CRISPR-associated protein Cmr1